jgi:prepilin-type N-terminal cleavage/methylation domain-containing protein
VTVTPHEPISGRSAGFTLVEVLAGLAIGAFLLVGIYSAFSFGARTKARLVQVSTHLDHSQLFIEGLSSELRCCVSFAPGRFEGSKDALSFRGFVPDDLMNTADTHSGVSGEAVISPIVDFEYDSDNGKGVRKRVFNLKSTRIDSTTFDIQGNRVVFSYLAGEGPADEWLDDWDDAESLPVAVRVQFLPEGADRGGRLEPDYEYLVLLSPLPIGEPAGEGRDQE